MRKKFIGAVVLLMAVTIGVICSNYPRNYIVVVPAECPQCLCLSIPTCGDVGFQEKGFPLVAERKLLSEEYVPSPYREQYKSSRNLTYTFIDFIVGFSSVCGLYIIILKTRKYANNRN